MAMLPVPASAAGAMRATEAYRKTAETPAAADGGFGSVLGRAMQGVVDSGHAADAQTAAALTGKADLTQVATAVTQAELALQTTNAIRDKVVQAYQDIMRMTI